MCHAHRVGFEARGDGNIDSFPFPDSSTRIGRCVGHGRCRGRTIPRQLLCEGRASASSCRAAAAIGATGAGIMISTNRQRGTWPKKSRHCCARLDDLGVVTDPPHHPHKGQQTARVLHDMGGGDRQGRDRGGTSFRANDGASRRRGFTADTVLSGRQCLEYARGVSGGGRGGSRGTGRSKFGVSSLCCGRGEHGRVAAESPTGGPNGPQASTLHRRNKTTVLHVQRRYSNGGRTQDRPVCVVRV